MKSLRHLLALLAVFGWFLSAQAQISALAVVPDGGNHSNAYCYITAASTQYVSTSSTPAWSSPTLPGYVNGGSSAVWQIASGTSTTQYTSGSGGFIAAANSGDVKGKNYNGGSVGLGITSFVAVNMTGTLYVSLNGASTTWELYKNGSLYSSGSGSFSSTILSVANGDQLWLAIKPANDNVNTSILASWSN